MPVVANLHYLVHWPTRGGYNFVSGPLADITLVTTTRTVTPSMPRERTL